MSKYVEDIMKKFMNDGYIPVSENKDQEFKCKRLVKSNDLITDILEIYDVEKITDELIKKITEDGIDHELYKKYIVDGNDISLERILVCKTVGENEKRKVLNFTNNSYESGKITLVVVSLDRAEIIFDDTKLAMQGKLLGILTDSIYKYSKGIFYYAYELIKLTSRADVRFYHQKCIWIPIFVRYILQAALILLFAVSSIANFVNVDSAVAQQIFIGISIGFIFAFASTFLFDLREFKVNRGITIFKFAIFIAFFLAGTYTLSTSVIDVFRAPIRTVVIVEGYETVSHGPPNVIVSNGDKRYVLSPSNGSGIFSGSIYRVKIYPSAKIIQQDGPCSLDEYKRFISKYGFKGMSKEEVFKLLGKTSTSKEYEGRQAYLYYYWNDHVILVFVFDVNGKVESCHVYEYTTPLDSF